MTINESDRSRGLQLADLGQPAGAQGSPSIRKAAVLSYAEKYAALLLGIVSTMILSRILTPEQVGIFSVAAVLTGIAGTVRDFGAGTYIIQEPDLTEQKVRSAFGLALLMGTLLSLLAAAISIPAAYFYSEPGVRNVLLVLALNFLIVPFGSITQALLVRDLRFGAVGLINVSHAFVHMAAGVALALAGFSYMSLAVAAVLATLTSAFVAAVFRPRHLPWKPSFSGMRGILGFGSQVSATTLVNEIHDGAGDLVVGRALGLEAAGYFGRANSLVTLYSRLVLRGSWPVAFSVFSQRNRDGGDVGHALRQFVTLVSGLAWPGLLFLGLYADAIIRVLFGSQWDAAVDPARFLVAAAFFLVPVSFCTGALIAVGDSRLALKLSCTQLAIRVAAVLLGVQYGLTMAAVAIAVGSLLASGTIATLAARRLAFGPGMWMSATRSSMALAIAANIIPAMLYASASFRALPMLIQLASAAALAVVGYLVAVFALRHPISEEIHRLARRLRKR